MDDVAHVRLVNAHAECVCGHHDQRVVVHERPLVGLAFAVGKARMIACGTHPGFNQSLLHTLDVLTCTTVHDAAVIRVRECACGRAGQLAFLGQLVYFETQVGTVEPGDDAQRLAQRE